jgi:HAD superfamily hydrolase (TIGR01484 family)
MITTQPQKLKDWPNEQRVRIKGVITDIDDTLTCDGRLMPESLDALRSLDAAGMSVLAVTGRPVGWCLPWLQGGALDQHGPLPFLGIVAENGAVALQGSHGRHVQRWYRDDEATRKEHFVLLQAALADVQIQVPGARPADDSAGRETDIAIDHSEHHLLTAQQIESVVNCLESHGLRTTVSSIHINAWLGDHNKWIGACWAINTWLGRDLFAEMDQWVYVGDSSNDEVMFEHLSNSVGVANVERFLAQMQFRPRFVCQHERGAGFAELAYALLHARSEN